MNMTVVEGGCRGAGEAHGIKRCPRCGATLFADMGTCYGCLYDFEAPPETPMGLPAAMGSPFGASMAAELGGAGAGLSMGATAAMGLGAPEWAVSEPLWLRGNDPYDDVPGTNDWFDPADAEVDEADETGELVELSGTPRYGVVLEWRGVRAPVAITAGGLSIGRAGDNDVVLKASAVSRHHVRVTAEDGAVLVHDAGASHPATIDGEEVEDCAPWLPGSILDICGAMFSLEMLDPRG